MINLIPMAGRGNRFFQEKYKLPKPFIPTLGAPMFQMAIKSFPKADKYVFICLKEHLQKFSPHNIFGNAVKNSEFIVLDEVTQGQACTCLLAEKYFKKEEGLFIASCDYQMIYDEGKYNKLLEDKNNDVIIWTFRIGTIKKADPKAFAYCRTDGDVVIEVVEKKTISNTPYDDPAVVGSFTYRNADLFVKGAKKMIQKNIRVNNEFYVATSINQLIEEGHRVVTFEIDKFISFGTPFELASAHYWQEYFDQLEDHPYAMNYGFKSRTVS